MSTNSKPDPCQPNTDVAPGWVGGFAEKYPELAYPLPSLKEVPMFDNLDKIDNIKRQQKVIWPEFSWETILGDPKSRCFQRFACDISRIGYDNTGRVWSIMCPQQGASIHEEIYLNLEISVTGQRGWVNEDEANKGVAVDMTVEGKIWFSPSSHQSLIVQTLWELFKKKSLPFPSNKANAIKVTTYKPGEPKQPIFQGQKGPTTAFKIPEFAQHPEAWAVGNLEVEIGPIKKINHHAVDTFNQKVLDLFNIVSANILKSGNRLGWNLWFAAPEHVKTSEWKLHAENWRTSIDADHGSPTGTGSKAKLFNGHEFHHGLSLYELWKEVSDIVEITKELLESEE